MNNSKFCRHLAATDPAIEALLSEGERENGEMLPYMFMSALCDHLSRNPDLDYRVTVVTKVEQGIQRWDEEVGELIAIGFVESLNNAQWELLTSDVDCPMLKSLREPFGPGW